MKRPVQLTVVTFAIDLYIFEYHPYVKLKHQANESALVTVFKGLPVW